MKIVTIIPAYNEERNIKDVIKGALKYSDVIVVDDGSVDNTSNIAKQSGAYLIKHKKNRGKGAAIKTGFKKALDNKYDIFILIDGDGQHNPDFIPALISKMGNADVVIGSRFKKDDPDNMPLQRKLSNKLTTKLVKFLTGYHITDSQSGFRSFSRDAARVFVDIPYDDYVYESEMFYQASKQKMVIKEEKISCSYKDEESYIKWINILRYIRFIFKSLLRKYQKKKYYFRFRSFIKAISRRINI